MPSEYTARTMADTKLPDPSGMPSSGDDWPLPTVEVEQAEAAPIPAEPADKAFAVWFDQSGEPGGGDPYAVFHRADRYMESPDDLYRWINADAYEGSPDVAYVWAELCGELAEFDGPHTLTLVRSDAPAVSS